MNGLSKLEVLELYKFFDSFNCQVEAGMAVNHLACMVPRKAWTDEEIVQVYTETARRPEAKLSTLLQPIVAAMLCTPGDFYRAQISLADPPTAQAHEMAQNANI